MAVEVKEGPALLASTVETDHLQAEAEVVLNYHLMTGAVREETSDREAIELSQGAIKAVFVKTETTHNRTRLKERNLGEIHRHAGRTVPLSKQIGSL